MYQKLSDLIGHTPMLELSELPGQQARPAVKLECFNPGGSVKDRIALAMIEDAEQHGKLRAGATIIEPTSGNTGVGLAWVGVSKGYNVILTMPDTMSVERRNLLKAYGAQLELTPGAEGMKGAIARAEQLRKAIPGAVILGQFDFFLRLHRRAVIRVEVDKYAARLQKPVPLPVSSGDVR